MPILLKNYGIEPMESNTPELYIPAPAPPEYIEEVQAPPEMMQERLFTELVDNAERAIEELRQETQRILRKHDVGSNRAITLLNQLRDLILQDKQSLIQNGVKENETKR